MQQTEMESEPDPSYMRNKQTAITENNRCTLVNWLLSVHAKFKLLPETLFITINLIDRYLSHIVIRERELQIVGVAALLIAMKYEEIYPPTVKDLVKVSSDSFTKDLLIEREHQILVVLQFQITQTSCFRFLERYSKSAKADSVIFFGAQYFLELSLFDSKMNQYPPSLKAAAALYLAMRINLKDCE